MGELIGIIILGTSIWVYFDAKSLGIQRGRFQGLANMGPTGWFFSCLLIWIVAFPMYLVKRKDCQRSQANPAATVTSADKRRISPLLFILLIILGLVVIAEILDSSSSNPLSFLGSSGTDVVTRAEYNRIQEGISYSDAVSIIGTPGEEISSDHFDGIPGVMESVTTKMYSWQNSDGSNMDAIFQNDKLTTKAQFGLK